MIFILEQWSEAGKRWIPTGNVRRTRKAAGELLLTLNKKSPGMQRQVQPYERRPENRRSASAK